MFRFLKYILLSSCFCLRSTEPFAQDPHFSQYFTSPMTLNPALTGKSVDNWRGSTNMRSQWWGSAIKPYYTVTASLEKKLGEEQHYWGLGGMVLSDQSNGGLLKHNYFSFSAAYHIGLDAAGRHMLDAGLTGTYANRILDAGKFLFQSQVGSMGFQREIPAHDGVDLQKSTYFDVSTGLTYSYTTDRYGVSAGAALFHAATPREGAYHNNTYHVPRKINLQADGWMNVGISDAMLFSTLAEIQGSHRIYTLGGVYKIGINSDLLHSINLGLWDRFGDAVYPYFALETADWIAGFTYDFVTSGVGYKATVQSVELSFVWQFGKKGSGKQ